MGQKLTTACNRLHFSAVATDFAKGISNQNLPLLLCLQIVDIDVDIFKQNILFRNDYLHIVLVH